jgi:hypothetical protein
LSLFFVFFLSLDRDFFFFNFGISFGFSGFDFSCGDLMVTFFSGSYLIFSFTTSSKFSSSPLIMKNVFKSSSFFFGSSTTSSLASSFSSFYSINLGLNDLGAILCAFFIANGGRSGDFSSSSSVGNT